MHIFFDVDLCYPYPTLDVLSGPLTEVSVLVPQQSRLWEVTEKAKTSSFTFRPYGKAVEMPWNAVILQENTVVEIPNVGDAPPLFFLVHRLELSRNSRWAALVEVYSLSSSMGDPFEFSEEIRAALESGAGRSLSFYVPRVAHTSI